MAVIVGWIIVLGVLPHFGAAEVSPLDGARYLGIHEEEISFSADLLDHLDGGPSTVDLSFLVARLGLDHHERMITEDHPAIFGDLLNRQRANLDSAENLISMKGDSIDDDFDQAVWLAKLGTIGQAKSLGFDWMDPVPIEGHEEPFEPLTHLAARHGVHLMEEDLESILLLNEHPLAKPLARVVDAFIAFDKSTASFIDVDEVNEFSLWHEASGFNNIVDVNSMATRGFSASPEPGVDMTLVFPSRVQLLEAINGLHEHMKDFQVPRVENCEPIQIPPAFSIDLTSCDNIHGEDFALIIDLGGYDTYSNNAGGSNIWGGCAHDPQIPIASALIDLGPGDDVHGGPLRRCGLNGGGYFGAGFLLNEKGNNTYRGSSRAVNGGGYSGSGFLMDIEGNDLYEARSFGTNGGSRGGSGFLLDGGGDDIFSARSAGTNGGGSLDGTGFLFSGGGDDVFESWGNGANGGGGGGGYGFLLSAGGNKTFSATIRGTNGGGASLGNGFLVNIGEGTHSYTGEGGGVNGGGSFIGSGLLIGHGERSIFDAKEDGVNGGANIYALGMLVSGPGNDFFKATDDGVNGGGMNGGHGVLINPGGDNTYISGSNGTNGGGSFAGRGFLLDALGNDTYTAVAEGTNGGANLGYGFLLDASGHDIYLDDLVECHDCTMVPKGLWAGAQIDSDGLFPRL